MVKKPALFLFALIIGFCGTTLWAASWPTEEFPQTVGIQTKKNLLTVNDFNLLPSTGVKFVRMGFYWSQIETTQGVYDFTSTNYDAYMSNWTASGIRVLACLYGNNGLYEDATYPGIVTEAGRQGFADFAAACASQYNSSNVVWGIWNEPNLRAFWHPTPEGVSNTDSMAVEYTALVKTVAPAMKATDPNSIIVAGSVSALWTDSFSWLDKCGEEGLFTSGIDGLSVHPYGFQWPELCIDDGYGNLRALMAQHGAATFPIINSEVGYDEDWLIGRGVPASEVEDYQAWQCVRQNLVDQMSDIGMTNWYEWKNDLFGVVNADMSLRPTYYALQTMNDILDGCSYLWQVPVVNSDDFVLAYEDQSENQILIAWTTPTPGEPNPKLPDPHYAEIPVIGTGPQTVYDWSGNQSVVTIDNEAITFYFEGGPKYIVLASGCYTMPPLTSTTDGLTPIPEGYALLPAFPNPLNPSTNIQYVLPEQSKVSLKVYDVRGHEVATLVDGQVGAGHHTVVWDAKNRAGKSVPSGTYLVRMVAGDGVRVTKLLLMK